jgi:hypothetical protein
MSNRETFRDDPLLQDLFKKLQKELHDHEGLKELNLKRYEEKIADAVDDKDGINALEELLSTDPSLADLFGSIVAGKVAAKTATDGVGGKIKGTPKPFQGSEFPTFFRRADSSTSVEINFPRRCHARFVPDRCQEQLFHTQKASWNLRIQGWRPADVPSVQWSIDVHFPGGQERL